MMNRNDTNKINSMLSTLIHANNFKFVDMIMQNTEINKLSQEGMIAFFCIAKRHKQKLKNYDNFVAKCENELAQRQEKKTKAFESNK